MFSVQRFVSVTLPVTAHSPAGGSAFAAGRGPGVAWGLGRGDLGRGLAGILLFVLLGLAGCKGEQRQERKRIEALRDTVKLFAASLRWGDYYGARKYLRPRPSAAGAGAPPEFSGAEPRGVKISRYEIIEIIVNPDTKEDALVITYFQYYSARSVAVRELVDRKNWWYDESSESWFRAAELPEFR